MIQKIIKQKKTIAVISLIVIMASLLVAADSDSLITKGYIDNVLMPQIESMAGGGEEKYTVISLSAGEMLVCEAGCEFIIRMGSGKIMASSKGGICDATAGVDLANGTVTPSNHLLIVPVSDGRGVVANNDMLVMIKGDYEIK